MASQWEGTEREWQSSASAWSKLERYTLELNENKFLWSFWGKLQRGLYTWLADLCAPMFMGWILRLHVELRQSCSEAESPLMSWRRQAEWGWRVLVLGLEKPLDGLNRSRRKVSSRWWAWYESMPQHNNRPSINNPRNSSWCLAAFFFLLMKKVVEDPCIMHVERDNRGNEAARENKKGETEH